MANSSPYHVALTTLLGARGGATATGGGGGGAGIGASNTGGGFGAFIVLHEVITSAIDTDSAIDMAWPTRRLQDIAEDWAAAGRRAIRHLSGERAKVSPHCPVEGSIRVL